jgi:hypothetical protein
VESVLRLLDGFGITAPYWSSAEAIFRLESWRPNTSAAQGDGAAAVAVRGVSGSGGVVERAYGSAAEFSRSERKTNAGRFLAEVPALAC